MFSGLDAVLAPPALRVRATGRPLEILSGEAVASLQLVKTGGEAFAGASLRSVGTAVTWIGELQPSVHFRSEKSRLKLARTWKYIWSVRNSQTMYTLDGCIGIRTVAPLASRRDEADEKSRLVGRLNPCYSSALHTFQSRRCNPVICEPCVAAGVLVLSPYHFKAESFPFRVPARESNAKTLSDLARLGASD